MSTRDIPRNEWRQFFDNFSLLHEGWLTTIEVSGGDVPGHQVEAEGLPFVSISADTKGSEPDSIEISVGRDDWNQTTHFVPGAARVQFEHTGNGEAESLEIKGADGETTIVILRAATGAEIPRVAAG